MKIFLPERVAGSLERETWAVMNEENVGTQAHWCSLAGPRGASSKGSHRRAAMQSHGGLPSPGSQVQGSHGVSLWFCCVALGGGSDMGALAAGSVRHSSPSQESKWRWGGMGESSALDAGPGIPPDPCGQRLASQVMPWGTRYEGPQTPTAGHVFSNICVCCEQRI